MTDNLKNFYESAHDLCNDFYIKYILEEWEEPIERDIWYFFMAMYKDVGIDHCYFEEDIIPFTDIQTALFHNIERKVFWYWFHNEYTKSHLEINLFHYHLKSKCKLKEYEENQLKDSKERLEKSKEIFEEAMNKYKV